MTRTVVGIGVVISSFLCSQGCHRNDDRSTGFSIETVEREVIESAGTARPIANTSSLVLKWRSTIQTDGALLSGDALDAAGGKNAAANELFSLPELPDGVVADLARMFASTDESEVWRDYCLQFLGGALERTDGVTDADRTLARETLVEALSSTNATFAGTALRALRRVDPSDPLVASNALRIARDSSVPSSSRTTALLILEECTPPTAPTSSTASTPSTVSTSSTLAELATAISADPTASPLLRRTAEAVARRHAADAD